MDDKVTLNLDSYDVINNSFNVNSREEISDSVEKTESTDDDSLSNAANIQVKNSKRKFSVESMDEISNKKQRFLDDLESTCGGLTLFEHGNIFQLKLSMLCLWRAAHAKKNSNKKYVEFRLSTEMSEAEKFDDVAFQYRDYHTSKWKFRLLQAKHKEANFANPLEKIKLGDLLSTDNKEDFSLQKYFNSYLKIKQRSKENSIYSVFSDCEIEDIIIITNTEFDSEKEKNIFIKSTEKDTLLGTKDSTIKVWKLNTNNTIINKLKIIFENSSEFYKLIELLAEHISRNKEIKKTNVFKEYYYPLVDNILKVDIKKPNKKKEYFINLNNLINETVLSKEENEIRNSLIKEMAFRKGKVNLPEIDKRFGNKDLPNDEGELKDLAKKFANTILEGKNLTVQDFEVYHIALANEVVNIKNGKLKHKFIKVPEQPHKNKEPTILGKFKTYFLQALNKQRKELKDLILNISEDFGISELSSDVKKLNKLANELAKIIVTNKKLTINDFQNTHVVLSEQVINTKARTCHTIFKNGKKLSPEAKTLRRLLLNEFEKHDVKIELNKKEITIRKLVKDKQSLQKLLKGGKIKASEGFVKSFEPNKNPEFENVDLFVQQMKIIIRNQGENAEVIEINDGIKKELNINDQQLKSFYDNIKKLAGYVLINRFTKIRFSTHFLNLKSDYLPKEINEFKNKLKTLLGDNKFASLFEYELKFDKQLKFNTCEDDELYRKLPVAHSEDNVNDFLSKLKLIVKYPNRMEIDDLLGTEINDKLNTLDSKVFQSLYYKNLHNWMADRVGTFYTAKKAKIMFQKMKDDISFFTIDGFNKVYFANSTQGYKFKKYDILDKFLLGDKQVLVLRYQDLLLGHTRIVQRFQELQAADTVTAYLQYTRKFGHIFLYLRQCADQDFKKMILKALEDKSKFNLIVIECGDQSQEMKVLFEKLYVLLKSDNNKKVIFITTKDNDTLVKNFANNLKYKIKDDETVFDHLTEESQKLLLKHTVKLQGQKVKINELIGKPGQMANEIIDTETLVKILNGKEINIGNTLQDLGEVNDYYIDRKFNVQVLFDKKKIKAYIDEKRKKGQGKGNQVDLFVISGSDNQLNNINIHETDNDELAEGKFQELCGKYPGSNIHWLKSDSGRLTWTKTHGSKSNLIQCRVNKIDKNFIKEEELIVNKNDVVIISDNSGMGKSTVLTKLSKRLKEKYPHLWVIKINLNEYTEALQKELNYRNDLESKFIKDVNKTINFLFKDLLGSQDHSKLKTKLEEVLFKNSFHSKVKIAWLFDGFDEISPDYNAIVIDLLQALKKFAVAKLFVTTTRTNVKRELETALNAFSCSLNPFSEELIEFFTKFWTKTLKLNGLNEERLKLYGNTIIDHFSESTDDEELISNPLHAKLLAEVFKQGCEEFLKSEEDEPNIPHEFSIFDLYEGFTKTKFDIYLQGKRGRDYSKVGEKKQADEEYAIFKTKHELLALDILFDNDNLEEYLSENEAEDLRTFTEEVETGSNNIGIVVVDYPYFTHRSFAEFFVANRIYSWLESWLEQDLDSLDLDRKKKILAELLIRTEYEVTQTFFDKKLKKQPINKWDKIFELIIGVYYDDDEELLEKLFDLLPHTKYSEYLIKQFYEKFKRVDLFEDLFVDEELDPDTIVRIIDATGNKEDMKEIGWTVILGNTSVDELEELIETYRDALGESALQNPLEDILKQIKSRPRSPYDSDEEDSMRQFWYINGEEMTDNERLVSIRDELRKKYSDDYDYRE